MSPDELPFIEEIHTTPLSDGPKLIYADFLDDRRDPRGMLIRRILAGQWAAELEYTTLVWQGMHSQPHSTGVIPLVSYRLSVTQYECVPVPDNPLVGIRLDLSVDPADDLAPLLTSPGMRRVHRLYLRAKFGLTDAQVGQLAACPRLPHLAELTISADVHRDAPGAGRLLRPLCPAVRFSERVARHFALPA